VSNHGREICTPECTLCLPVVEQHTGIEGCIDVQVLEMPCYSHFKVQSQDLSVRWVPASDNSIYTHSSARCSNTKCIKQLLYITFTISGWIFQGRLGALLQDPLLKELTNY
jgi:hypothetical protein